MTLGGNTVDDRAPVRGRQDAGAVAGDGCTPGRLVVVVPGEPRTIEITIPGEPFSQPRHRVAIIHGFARAYEPKEAKAWKGGARMFMARAVDEARVDLIEKVGGKVNIVYPTEPVGLFVEAVFSLPVSQYRKDPRPRRRHIGPRFNMDNIQKAIMDAAEGILYTNDGQVAHLVGEKWVGAQGEAPYVRVKVWRLE